MYLAVGPDEPAGLSTIIDPQEDPWNYLFSIPCLCVRIEMDRLGSP
jgi:hypothetical protein